MLNNIGAAPMSNIVPVMDIHAVRAQLYRCAERSHNHCNGCKYIGTQHCKARLMYEAAHALSLLLDERDNGARVVVPPMVN